MTRSPEEEIIFSDVPPMTQFGWDNDDNVSVLSDHELRPSTKRKRSDEDDPHIVKRSKRELNKETHSTVPNLWTIGTRPLRRESKRRRIDPTPTPRKKRKTSTPDPPSTTSVSSGQSTLPSHQTALSDWTPLPTFHSRSVDAMTATDSHSQYSSTSSSYVSQPRSNLVSFNNKRKRDLDNSFQRRTKQRKSYSTFGSFSSGTPKQEVQRRNRTTNTFERQPLPLNRPTKPRSRQAFSSTSNNWNSKGRQIVVWDPRNTLRDNSESDSITEFSNSPSPQPRYSLQLIESNRMKSNKRPREYNSTRPRKKTLSHSDMQKVAKDDQRMAHLWGQMRANPNSRFYSRNSLSAIPEENNETGTRVTGPIQTQPVSRFDDIDTPATEIDIPILQGRSQPQRVKRRRPQPDNTSEAKRRKQTPATPMSTARQFTGKGPPTSNRDNAQTSYTKQTKRRSDFPNNYLYMVDKYKYKNNDNVDTAGTPRPSHWTNAYARPIDPPKKTKTIKSRKGRSDFPNNYLYMLDKYKYENNDEDDVEKYIF
jgi:hypothetical protein